MTTQHTKGPWALNNKNVPLVVSDGKVVADCSKTAFPKETELDNAHLIAAAPDLLEALEMFLDDTSGINGLSQQRAKARAAIAKAKGETK